MNRKRELYVLVAKTDDDWAAGEICGPYHSEAEAMRALKDPEDETAEFRDFILFKAVKKIRKSVSIHVEDLT